MNEDFDEIRPYNDEELPQIFEELIADPAFRQVVCAVMPGVPYEALAAQMRACKTKLDFQMPSLFSMPGFVAFVCFDNVTAALDYLPAIYKAGCQEIDTGL